MTDNFDDLRDPSNQGGQGGQGDDNELPADPGQASNDPFAFDDLSSFDEPTFRDPGADADLPDELGPAEPTERSRNFIIGLIALVALLVVGLILILFAAAEIGRQNEFRRQTVQAIVATNDAVSTAVAATATAKSWTLTPSNTPSPTYTLTYTPSLTPSNTPTLTYTPSLTVTGTASPSLTPTFTETPTQTAIPTREGAIGTADAIGTFGAQLQAGIDISELQGTLNGARQDPQRTEAAQRTQNAQFNAYQTFAAGELTGIPGTLTAVFGGGANQPNTGGLPVPVVTGTPTLSPTPSPVSTPGGTPLGQRPKDDRNVVALQAPPQRPPRQGIEPNATNAPIFTQIAQLNAAATGNAYQATLNAINYPNGTYPPPVLTQNAQINLGGTAIAFQLTINARLLRLATSTPGPVSIEPTALPDGGFFDDLASGGASGSGLALFGFAAVGLVAVIVAARRMRVRE